VTVGGVDLRDVDTASLLQRVGVVLQEPFVLNESARDNIALTSREATESSIERGLREALLEDTMARLPAGADTPLGEGGRLLSGGERQRLAIARAVAREPWLLVLDEATSSLDSDTEARVHRALTRLSCTQVIIAHRYATVKDADRVLVVDGGRIVDEGRFAEVAPRCRLLADMARGLAV
jgi:ATP-binding cassette, subfamily B, bacterial